MWNPKKEERNDKVGIYTTLPLLQRVKNYVTIFKREFEYFCIDYYLLIDLEIYQSTALRSEIRRFVLYNKVACAGAEIVIIIKYSKLFK